MDDTTTLEYMYARYYLKPADVDGMQRVIWIDSDTFVQGDVAVAAANYWEPLKEYLCTNPRLEKIKMKPSDGRAIERSSSVVTDVALVTGYTIPQSLFNSRGSSGSIIDTRDCLFKNLVMQQVP